MRHLLTATIFLTISSLATPSMAYDFYDTARKKQDAKDAKRWSLSQWLDQKKNIKLMDMWLMYNAPSPYEFFFGADTSSITQFNDGVENMQSYRNYRGHFGAFVTIVGLYAEYESSDEELEQWKALFMLRLLGSSDQSTNITIHYGLMNRDFNNDKTQHQVGGGKINLYLIRAFALHGMYEYILKGESEAGIESEGYRVEGGAHIEYGALRFYGAWFNEKLDVINTLNQESVQKRQGVLFGTRIYF
ncbi:MAG: hypothetical protein HRT44_05370 [Bdellovibrionales bacterium]|nr:hypothetical protein [Bdellovibrionales bacterium]NQZ18672.1 hypothetical protein [Bdellovibrionales bacterium]